MCLRFSPFLFIYFFYLNPFVHQNVLTGYRNIGKISSNFFCCNLADNDFHEVEMTISLCVHVCVGWGEGCFKIFFFNSEFFKKVSLGPDIIINQNLNY